MSLIDTLPLILRYTRDPRFHVCQKILKEQATREGTQEVAHQATEGKVANLVRYPPGSNGGVHRGPDKFPRRNAVRAVFLHAMAQDQERVQIDPSTGQPELDETGKPVKRPVKFAMVQDIVTAYQFIARNAASGKDLDQFLRMMADAHNMLQPEKDEAGAGRAPIPARFRVRCGHARSATRE